MVPDERVPPTLRTRAWTPAQVAGITTTGHSLLVSAAAGSGKTAMLATRCAYLVCDAPKTCDVDELLVVTFTEAAAAEMKGRIHHALRARMEAGSDERLRRQLALIDHAQVSTLHSFCAKLLRQHFHEVGLDPAFEVLDGDEAALLRREVARELFDDRYELDTTGDFHRFVDAYGEGEDAPLIRRVIDCHEMLESLVDPAAWIDAARRQIAETAEGPLEDSRLGNDLASLLTRQLENLTRQCQKAGERLQPLGRFPAYVNALAELAKIVQHVHDLLRDEGLDTLVEFLATLTIPNLPSIKGDVPNKEAAKEIVSSVKTQITRGWWRSVLRFTAAEWQDGLARIRPHAEVFLKFVDEFGARYRQGKDAARSVDFSDLERFTLRVLRDDRKPGLMPTPAARVYHRRFKHVLVDEYQDINEVQDAILSLLSRECAWGEKGQDGNLFCVGDVKQSIYRFRLAEAHRFLERQELFRQKARPRRGELIDLQSNFRSRKPLLDAINGVFERLMTAEAADIEYDRTHRLHAGLDYPQPKVHQFAGAPIEMHLLPDDLSATEDEENGDVQTPPDSELDRTEREAVLVAQRIRALMGLDGGTPMQVTEKDAAGNWVHRPIRFRDIVVLLRAMRYKAEQFAAILRRHGIPVHSQSSTGFFEAMEVRDMLALLSLLDNQGQDLPLAAVLRSPIAGMPEPENCLARIRLAYPENEPQSVPFHEALVRYSTERDDELAARLRDFLDDLTRWRRLARLRPLADLIWTIYHETGYLAFCSGLHGGEQRAANLMYLHERAGQFGSFHRQGLARFLRFLENLKDEADLGQPSVASEADDVVRVMSIHRAKGLEFPVVFLPDVGKGINLQDCNGTILFDRKAGLGLSVVDEERMVRYPSLASTLVRTRLKQQALAEELRVLYVAMTRAKEHLVLVGTCAPDRHEKWRSRWSHHAGALPADDILAARSLLDWLGPAAAAAEGAGREIIHVTSHAAAEVGSWETESAGRVTPLTERQRALAELRPLSESPAIDGAQSIIRRLNFRYGYRPFTEIGAADSVTARGKQRAAATAESVAKRLARPAFLAGSSADPTEIGTATHLVLQHLDFRGREDLDRQIESLIDRRLILPAQAALVDRPSVMWMLESEIGRMLREHSDLLRREIAVYFAAAPDPAPPEASCDPLDRVMVRGRLDVLIPAPDGAIILDYKTDDVSADTMAARAESYAGQMRQYRDAIAQITGMPVARTALVFLKPRLVSWL